MPVYAFSCAGCGSFEVVRPMSAAGAPARCPTCGGESQRVYTPPALARLAAPMRRALDSEEKSAHEPELTSQKSGSPMPHRHEPSPPWTVGH